MTDRLLSAGGEGAVRMQEGKEKRKRERGEQWSEKLEKE